MALNKIVGLDALRGIAAFGIVGCHLSLSPRTEGGLFITNLCDLNVGVFAAVAGYLMAQSKPCTWREYLRRRVRRLLPIYFAWTGVYLVVTAVFQYLESGAVDSRYLDGWWWLSVLFRGNASAHLWFLIALFYAQCVFWSVLPRVRKELWVLVSLCLILPSVFADNLFIHLQLRLCAFLLLGYGLSAVNVDCLSARRSCIWVILVAALCVHFLQFPFSVGFLKDWIAAAPILLAFVSLPQGGAGWVNAAGATSMGVYLAHPLFTRFFKVVVDHIFQAPYGIVPVSFSWGASWACAFILTAFAIRSTKLRRWVS